MKTKYFINDKVVQESEILISMKLVKSIHQELYDVSNPNEKKLIREIHEEYYETKAYQQHQQEEEKYRKSWQQYKHIFYRIM